MNAVILFSHGSLLCGAGEALKEQARRLEAQEVASMVRIGYLNYSEPLFATTVAEVVEAGATRIIVAPYFLVPGKFVRVDLPKAVEAARQTHPGVEFVVAEAIGFDERLADALRDSYLHPFGRVRWRDDLHKATSHCRPNPECPLYGTTICPKVPGDKQITESFSATADERGLPYADVAVVRPGWLAINAIPVEVATRLNVMPLALGRSRVGSVLYVAMESLHNMEALDELRLVTGRTIKPVLSLATEIRSAIRRWYKDADLVDRESTLSTAKDAVLIMVHGSPRPVANEDMFRVVEILRQRMDTIIEIGFMECNEPDIPTAIDRCVEQGATSITAVPYFLHTGTHVADDLPTLMEAGQERHPDVRFLMAPYLGRSEWLTEILIDRIRATGKLE